MQLCERAAQSDGHRHGGARARRRARSSLEGGRAVTLTGAGRVCAAWVGASSQVPIPLQPNLLRPVCRLLSRRRSVRIPAAPRAGRRARPAGPHRIRTWLPRRSRAAAAAQALPPAPPPPRPPHAAPRRAPPAPAGGRGARQWTNAPTRASPRCSRCARCTRGSARCAAGGALGRAPSAGAAGPASVRSSSGARARGGGRPHRRSARPWQVCEEFAAAADRLEAGEAAVAGHLAGRVCDGAVHLREG
jgi:hypothetical protein